MRWLVLLLVVPVLAGCFGIGGDKDEPRPVEPADVGRDPSSVRVTSVERVAFYVHSFDGTNLSAIAYVPQGELPAVDGRPDPDSPTWPVVIFLHGWGGQKENYEGTFRGNEAPELPPEGSARVEVNHLQEFAQAGFIAVAYDARGFGESGGDTAVAGPNEIKDFEAVRAFVDAEFDDNGHFGATGQSYGGGQSYLVWAQNPHIITAVPHYGWVDLYDSLLPGGVPKIQWAEFLYLYGLQGARGDYSPTIHEWYGNLYTRADLPRMEEQMDARSVRGMLATTTKPLLACQGMQESLFPQIDEAWEGAAGFTRAYVFTGGHGADDTECWRLTLDWFRFFLAGFDTEVDSWPALRTQDASGEREVSYATFPESTPQSYNLRSPDLVQGGPSGRTFTITQDVASNPFVEPGALWDQIGMPNQALPPQLRDDPTAVFFTTSRFDEPAILLGAPTLRLAITEGSTPFQVTAMLFRESEAGSQILSRAAAAPLAADEIEGGTVDLRFHWVKADIEAGDRIVLKVAANDLSWFIPLAADYEVTFSGESELSLPFFKG